MPTLSQNEMSLETPKILNNSCVFLSPLSLALLAWHMGGDYYTIIRYQV